MKYKNFFEFCHDNKTNDVYEVDIYEVELSSRQSKCR